MYPQTGETVNAPSPPSAITKKRTAQHTAVNFFSHNQNHHRTLLPKSGNPRNKNRRGTKEKNRPTTHHKARRAHTRSNQPAAQQTTQGRGRFSLLRYDSVDLRVALRAAQEDL